MQGDHFHTEARLPKLAAAILIATSLLTGCFQNLSSSLSSASKTSSSQSSFTDVGGTTGGFDGATIVASTASGGLVGSYASPTSSSTLGLMVNLKNPIISSIGNTTLTDLLNRVDTDASVQNIDVVLQIPQFGIQVKFKFAKIAYGNSKQLRNVLSIRPGATGADVATGYIPDTAPLIQQSNGYIFSYGGLVDGSATARLSIFYRSDLTNSTGFLPSLSNTNWGVGFPDNGDPQSAPIFMRLTQNLAKIFARLYTDPNSNTWSADANFQDISSNYGKYLLAIHLDPTLTRGIVNGASVTETDLDWYSRAITKAWIINPITTAPLALPLCSSDQNDNDSKIPDPADNTHEFLVASKRACFCQEMQALGAYTASNKVFETCSSTKAIQTLNYIVPNKMPYLVDAITNSDTAGGVVGGTSTGITNPLTPTSGSFVIGTVTSNGFTLSPL